MSSKPEPGYRSNLPVIAGTELAPLRAAAKRVKKAEDELADAKAAMYQLAAELRDEFPGRGTVTAMADVITEEVGDHAAHRRTSLSRTISAIRFGRRNVDT